MTATRPNAASRAEHWPAVAGMLAAASGLAEQLGIPPPFAGAERDIPLDSAFLFGGLGLMLLHRAGSSQARRAAGKALAAAVLAVGLLAALGPALAAGALLMPDNRSGAFAACACLVGAALLLSGERGRLRSVPPLLAVPVILLSLVALNQALYGVQPDLVIGGPAEPLAFLLLGSGILAAHADREPLATFLSAGSGGFVSRRMLAALLLLAIALGWLRVAVQHAGLVDTDLGTAVMVTLTAAVTTAVTWTVARWINRAERMRDHAEERLRELNAQLERRVAERTAQLQRLNHELRSEIGAAEAARSALRVSEESYRFMFECNPLPLCMFDHETLRYSAVNQAMVVQYGYSREEFLDMTADQIRPPEEATRLRAYVAQTHPGYNHAGRWRHVKKDGSMIDVEVYEHVARLGGRLRSLVMPFDITERLKAEEALQDHAVRLRRLSQQLLHVQEAERARMARELHDQIGQTLTAAKLGLQSVRSAVSDSAAAGRLEDSIRLAAQVLQQVRDLSLDLRPPLLDELGLTAALGTHVQSLARRTGLAVEFRAEPLSERPSQEVAIACFRIAQEAMTNAMRHARPAHIRVSLREHAGELELSVSDDGIGFDLDASRRLALTGKSIGLLSMTERAALAGGRCEITSAARHGTSVRAAFPLSASTRQPAGVPA